MRLAVGAYSLLKRINNEEELAVQVHAKPSASPK
jgi:hypothetical protein